MEKLDNKNEKSNQFDWLLSEIENILSNTPKNENKKEYLLKYLAENYGQSLANMILENLPPEMFEEGNVKKEEAKELVIGKKNKSPEETKIDQEQTKINKIKEELTHSIENKEFGPLTIEDIPTYMYGDRWGGFLFEKQIDDATKPVVYRMHGFGRGDGSGDTRGMFDHRYDKGDNSDTEIITKKQIVELVEKMHGKKPFWGKDNYKEDRESFKKERDKIYDVLHIYLRAHGPRDISTTTIGIKIPESVTPSSFMEKLAKEIYEADKNIGALQFPQSEVKKFGASATIEFDKRQSELKKIAQELFLKYANEQIMNKKQSSNN